MTARTRSAIGKALAAITIAAFLLASVGGAWGGSAVPVHAATQALADDLIAYWKLEEATGTRGDSVGTNCGGAGCHLNAVTGGPFNGAGVIGNALVQTGSSAVRRDNHADLTTGDIDFTVGAWVYLTDKGADRSIISKANAAAGFGQKYEYELQYNNFNDRFLFLVSSNGEAWATQVIATSHGSPSLNTWYYVVAWHDAAANSVNIQVNDGTVDSASHAGVVKDTVSGIGVGARNDSNQSWHGAIDEAAFWKRVLTSGERTTLYNGGAGCAYDQCINPPAPGTHNYIQDGNMESSNSQATWPFDTYWSFGGGPGTKGAVFNAYNRTAACGTYFSVLGQRPATSLYPRSATSMSQPFTWPGGTAHVSWQAMGSWQTGAGYLSVRLVNVDTGQVHTLRSNKFYAANAWTPDTVSQSLAAGEYELELRAGGSYLSAPHQWVGVDDVWVGGSAYSHCTSIQPTATPTATRTPTRTPTPTGTWSTQTPTPLPTAGTNVNIGNCNFEAGSAGWVLNGNARIELSGGPVGPQYGLAPNASSSLVKRFTWPVASTAFFTYWIGPGSYGEVNARNVTTGLSYGISTHSGSNSIWQQHQATRQLPAGTYDLTFQAWTAAGFRVDGLSVSRFGYGTCGTGATPTSGPTSFVTATATRTPTAGPSPTATSTNPAAPTPTPFPTWTPPPATVTAMATHTQPPTPTQPPAEQTATAQGTAVATYTPNATYTPPPATAMPDPPQQPPVSGVPDECIRPDNPINLAWWADYGVCQSMQFMTWNQTNTDQLTSLFDSASEREPFGTIAEVMEAAYFVRTTWEGTNWAGTGGGNGGGSGGSCNLYDTDPGVWVQDATGMLTGDFNFDQAPINFDVQTCGLSAIAAIVGPSVERPICYSLAVMCHYGLLQYTQWILNTMLVLLFVWYIQAAWIARATNG